MSWICNRSGGSVVHSIDLVNVLAEGSNDDAEILLHSDRKSDVLVYVGAQRHVLLDTLIVLRKLSSRIDLVGWPPKILPNPQSRDSVQG
jgi:hypothetical protein